MKSSIYLMRHGSCEDGRIFRGHWDSPLNPAGHQQMLLACPPLENFDAIISSPLSRCVSVAKELCNLNEDLHLEVDEGLKEIHFGDWEGRLVEKLMQEQQAQLENFWLDPVTHSPPNGETMENFNLRVCQSWKRILHKYKNQQVLIISHGGVIRCILANVLGMSLRPLSRLSVPHACISQIDVFHEAGKPDWPQLMRHGDTSR